MDRPVTGIDKSKEYVQPQYIVDSINNLFLLPTKPYMPGIVSNQHILLNRLSLLNRLLRHICPLSLTTKQKVTFQIAKERSTPWQASSQTLQVQLPLATIQAMKRAKLRRTMWKGKLLQMLKMLPIRRVILTLVQRKRAHLRSFPTQTRKKMSPKSRKAQERRLKRVQLL